MTLESKAESFLDQQGWNHRPSGDGSNHAVEYCPVSGCGNWKFYMVVGGDKDGVWRCARCEEHGNLYQLKQRVGVNTEESISMKTAAGGYAPESLPDFNFLHRTLMENSEYGDVLDYLVCERKFSVEIIQKLKLGACKFQSKKEQDDGSPPPMVKAYVIPYFDSKGKPLSYKARSVPPNPKEFFSPRGRESGLYNAVCLKPDMEELCIVEGEADCIALLSQGYETVVGVPGAAVKKATWIDQIDRIAPKNIYTVYDLDKIGQDNAQAMAVKIGIDKVKNILLPSFGGKDVNEFFSSGHTLEEFEALKVEAKPFDVHGVQSLETVIGELIDDLEKTGGNPEFDTAWPSLTRRVGGFERGDLVGIMAEGKCGKSTMALNMLQYYSSKGYTTLMHCLEMPPKRMVRKWTSHVMQCDDTPGRSKMTPDVVRSSLSVAREMEGDILFGYSQSHKAQDTFDIIRQAVRRYGVDVVCFDNLQLLVRSLQHTAQETSVITKDFKGLAMELNILLLLIIQPHRVAEGQVVASRNASGSSAIEKDVDLMMCLHRNRVAKLKAEELVGPLETEENFEPQMYVRVDLARYAPGGVCTLFMDGATSTVRELGDNDLVSVPTPQPGGIQVEQVLVEV
jgi:KaiC/GvpD/RAD55 family RecA-like ATPase